MKIRYAVASNRDRVRKNEDAFIANPALGIFAVADGMGGPRLRGVASRIAIESLRDSLA
jgi:protein phosphatase